METIGDAYCVAAGLHRKSLCHAKPIALMALKMMELSEEVLTPDGRPIQVTFLQFGLSSSIPLTEGARNSLLSSTYVTYTFRQVGCSRRMRRMRG